MKDSAFQPYQLDRWMQVLPDANVVRIESAGHWPHEEEPALVIDAMTRFLQKQN
jgi:pimeloyl-ACP methyl ester carboxylesterase